MGYRNGSSEIGIDNCVIIIIVIVIIQDASVFYNMDVLPHKEWSHLTVSHFESVFQAGC